MKHLSLLAGLSLLCLSTACGSGDSGSGSGAGGSSGSKGTTCADGYPTLDTACAIPNEKCVSCGSGYPCCDIFQCQSTGWAQLQSHATCPPDVGADTASDAPSDAPVDAPAE